MSTITTKDGVTIFYKDWGPNNAQPIVFHHGWPLSADDWDTQMLYFLGKGYRVVAHDRRGHGRSGQVSDGHDMDHYAADAAAVVEHLGLRDAIHIGHSTGGGEADALRRAPWQGPCRQAGAHRRRAAAHAEDGGQSGRLAHRGLRRPPATARRQPGPVLPGIRERSFLRLQPAGREAVAERDRQLVAPGDDGRRKAQYDGIKAFSETDFTEDLKKIDVPTLVLHGDDDQIVPIADSALLSSKLLKKATLKVHEGFPHGMCTTHADVVNADLLAFVEEGKAAS